MPEFTLFCENAKGDKKHFYYNTDDSSLKDASGSFVVSPVPTEQNVGFSWDKNNPAPKSNNPTHLKISMGLSCNYECSYCSQRFVPHADQSSLRNVNPFLEKMPTWYAGGEDGQGKGTQIEFWGGEPLVYWKTLVPLVEGIRDLYPNATLLMITNGSLLDSEKVDWIDKVGLRIGLSHDGPGYHIRGEDPLDNPEQRKHILDLHARLAPQGRMSVNAMIHVDNPSRAAVQKHLQAEFGEDVVIGEGGFIDAYDPDGLKSLLRDKSSHIEYRRQALIEILQGHADRFVVVGDKTSRLLKKFETGALLTSINQKCGMDNPNNLSVDLEGNVITCQNVSKSATAPNGESHLCGNVSDFDNVRVKTITSWNKRDLCPKCPVVHVCRGSCTFLEGVLFDETCESAYSDNIVFLAAAIHHATDGYTPVYIEGDMPEDRKDIFGFFGEAKPELKV